MKRQIPVVDVFAGCGGLGEGFNSLCKDGCFPFDVRLNVEKEPIPLRTLRLRTFFHSFRETSIPDSYYRYIRGEIELSDLFRLSPQRGEDREHTVFAI